MDVDRLAVAFERNILHPREQIRGRRDSPDGMTIETNRGWYDFEPADWLVARELWVEEAVRVVLSSPIEHVPVPTYGLIVPTDGEALFVNKVDVVRELGLRLGEELDPLAYAELLAEFYSVPDIDGPVVRATAVSDSTRSGWLVWEVSQIIAKFPFLDPALMEPPSVHRSTQQVELAFNSCHYHEAFRGSVDVLRWRVTGGPASEVRWVRDYAAKCVSRP